VVLGVNVPVDRNKSVTVAFLLFWLQPQERRLYSLMLIIALMVELYATWIGNWVWHADVPYFDFSSNNPPIAAGAFYCMLDVLVALSMRLIIIGHSRSSDQLPAIAKQ
jgi:hypothetical protein